MSVSGSCDARSTRQTAGARRRKCDSKCRLQQQRRCSFPRSPACALSDDKPPGSAPLFLASVRALAPSVKLSAFAYNNTSQQHVYESARLGRGRWHGMILCLERPSWLRSGCCARVPAPHRRVTRPPARWLRRKGCSRYGAHGLSARLFGSGAGRQIPGQRPRDWFRDRDRNRVAGEAGATQDSAREEVSGRNDCTHLSTKRQDEAARRVGVSRRECL